MSMSEPFYLTAGDRWPPYRQQLVDSTGRPFDLTNAESVDMSMTNIETGQTVIDRQGMTIETPPTDGIVSRSWGANETTEPGNYVVSIHPVITSVIHGTVPSGPVNTVQYVVIRKNPHAT